MLIMIKSGKFPKFSKNPKKLLKFAAELRSPDEGVVGLYPFAHLRNCYLIIKALNNS